MPIYSETINYYFWSLRAHWQFLSVMEACHCHIIQQGVGDRSQPDYSQRLMHRPVSECSCLGKVRKRLADTNNTIIDIFIEVEKCTLYF